MKKRFEESSSKIEKLHLRKHANRAVRAGGTGGHSPSPHFGRLVNHISTRGADYAIHITTCPHGFSDFPMSLTKDTKDKVYLYALPYGQWTCEEIFFQKYPRQLGRISGGVFGVQGVPR